MMTEYRGRKLVTKKIRNGRTGERRIEVRCNGRFCWSEYSTDEAAVLEDAQRYVDEAEQRPGAYPNLRVGS